MSVLHLDSSGVPLQWITYDDAILFHAKNQVVWSLGDVVARYHGGIQAKSGVESYLETTSIIATVGHTKKSMERVALTNRTLFGRDLHVCAYCGQKYHWNQLSRDHIVPRSKGGRDIWTNVVSACKSCNNYKGDKTLQESGLELLYVPYVPNFFEKMILNSRNILADQMKYLIAGVPKHSRILLN